MRVLKKKNSSRLQVKQLSKINLNRLKGGQTLIVIKDDEGLE